MGPYSFIHLKRGKKRAPPRRSETSSSFALAIGMPESSFCPEERVRVSDVSQSGLTHDWDFDDLVSSFGLDFSMEDLMENANLSFGEGRRIDFAVKREE